MSLEQYELRRLVANWSDVCAYPKACAFVEKYQHLLPNRITKAQLSGLSNQVSTNTELGKVCAFANHQGVRAKNRRQQDVQVYWDALNKALNALRGDAEELWKQAQHRSCDQDSPSSEVPADLDIRLAREFVRHLIAHSTYLAKAGAHTGNEGSG